MKTWMYAILLLNVFNDTKLCMQRYMIEMVKERRNSDEKGERYDLFSSLLDANEGESDNHAKLTDRELRGEPSFICIFHKQELTRK